MNVADWLKSTSTELADAMIPSAGLDAEIILAHTLGKHRTWLHAHGEEELDPRRVDIANARAQLRLERVPIAYIIGHKEFYGRRFFVNPDVLIPRPESEAIIELLKSHCPSDTKQLVDVGTGSGCLGITAKLEMPSLSVTLTDISQKALTAAKKNCQAYSVDARLLKSDLLDAYPLRAEVILANLPYIDPEWTDLSPELSNEPSDALYADDHGLALIKSLLEQAPSRLRPKGIIIIEADPTQHDRIEKFAKTTGFTRIDSSGYILVFRRS